MTYKTEHRDNKSHLSAQSGFTLVELVMTLAVGALLMTQVIPSFQDTIQGNRLVTETNKLVADINLARSEAIKRGVNLVLCSSANPNAAAPTCSGSTDWSTGWLIFSDGNGNGNFAAAANETLIRIGQGQVTNSDATLISSAASFTYTSDGLTTSAATVVVAICDDRGVNEGRQIQVNPTGRPRLNKSSPIPSCTAPAAA